MVALGRAVGVVVDRLAGAREHPGAMLFSLRDQVSIGLAALKCDPHGHLAQRAAGQRERTAEALRAEDDVDAERSSLPDQAVEPQGGLLGELVLLDEELLEFVDDQQDAGQRRRAGGVAIAVDVLHAGIAEPVGTQAKLGVQPLEHADAELALALDRDDARVGQFVGGVDLELDALLEVDQVEVDLVGAVVQGEVGDQGVHQGRLARAGATGDQHVLRGALPEREVLPLGGAGLAERNVDPGAAVAGPVGAARRADEIERHLDALGVPGGGADFLDLAGGELGRRRAVEGKRIFAEVGVVPGKAAAAPFQVRWAQYGPQLVERETGRQGFGRVGGDQGQHAARDAPGGDCGQPGGRFLVELAGKVGDDQHAVGLRDLSGHGVVFFDRRVLIAEVFLRHGFHVGRQVGEPLLDLAGVGPDLVGHQARRR